MNETGLVVHSSDRLTAVVVCKSGRLHAIVWALVISGKVDVFVLTEVDNPGLREVAVEVRAVANSVDREVITAYAQEVGADFVVIGPEEPLEVGVVDRLREAGIQAVGPTQALAQIETSKSFTRELLAKHNIPGNPEFRVFRDDTGLAAYLHRLGEFVIKPDGLTGGKGVRVSGDHFSTVAEGLEYCREVLQTGGILVIEEKLDGEEFTFQSFCDGTTLIDMVPVQDHKRLLNEDRGPNTGGMGAYSCADHLLPFLKPEHVAEASQINKLVANALRKEFGEPYKGILYGSFILTARGLKIIEYNARFGDPEVMNVLSILDGNFADICIGIIEGTLSDVPVRFQPKATVCKYIVPEGYPDKPLKGAPISLDRLDTSNPNLRVFYGAIDDRSGDLRMTGSRAIAFVGIGDTLAEAEAIAEAAARQVDGPVYHRGDIGTAPLIERRIDHMHAVLTRPATHRSAKFG